MALGYVWHHTLNREQIAAVRRIRLQTSGGMGYLQGPDGWTVFMEPTTGLARYLELRHYLKDGRLARWVIERDGTVSAHNDRGTLRELVAA